MRLYLADLRAMTQIPDVLTNAVHSTVTVADGPVHVVSYGGREAQHMGRPLFPTFVLVHGLGGSHLNWDLLAPELVHEGRVYAIDLPGFGRSEPGGRSCDVPSNVAVLTEWLEASFHSPVVLVGNSMGGMISVLTAAARPDLVAGLVLLDPAAPLPGPGLGFVGALVSGATLVGLEHLMGLAGSRLSHEVKTKVTMAACGVDPSGLPQWLVDRTTALMSERLDTEAMDAAFFQAARSCTAMMVRPGVYRRAMDAVQCPVLLIHGDRDRLVNVRSARDVAKRHPDWRYVELHGVGHVPQIEVPHRTALEIQRWL